MQGIDSRDPTSGPPPPDIVRAAFRDLHARRLHGFALLLTLGDRTRAARLTAQALSAGSRRVGELRHPERAAAWLRRHVLRGMRGHRATSRRTAAVAVLAELGAGDPVVAGLAALDRVERAALIASSIERLDRRDVALVVGRDGRSLDRLIHRARSRYAAAGALAVPEILDGPLVDRIRSVAQRAMS